jgi:nucleoside-diphosphate-sugar epimerase
MKILLTGGTGFIGSAIINKIQKYNVLILTREKKKNYKKIKFHTCNLENPKTYIKAIQNFQPNIVINLAWKNLKDYSEKNCKLNQNMHLNFYNTIYKIKTIKKILIAGSCFEYNFKSKKSNERNLVNTSNCFSISKNFLSNYIFEKYSKKINTKIAWFRIFFCYGNKNHSNTLIESLVNSKNNIKILYPENKCDFVHIDDVAIIFKKAIIQKFRSGIYNIGTGNPTKVRKICQIIKKITKKNNFEISKNKKKKYNFWSDNKKIKKEFKTKKFIDIYSGISGYINK